MLLHVPKLCLVALCLVPVVLSASEPASAPRPGKLELAEIERLIAQLGAPENDR